MGIASATAISAWINTFLLFLLLRYRGLLKLDSQLIRNSFKIIISMIIMFGVCYSFHNFIFESILDLNFLYKLSGLFLTIAFCKIIYLGMIFMLKVITIEDLKGYIKK